MQNLKEKKAVLSDKEMKCITGGMKWTKDRSVNVEDRRTMGGESMAAFLERKASYTPLEILYGYANY